MAEKYGKTTVRHRVLGNTDQLSADTAIHAWMPPSAAQVDAMPELPEEENRAEGSAAAQQSQLPWGIEAGTTDEFILHHQDEAASVLSTMLGREETPATDGPVAGLTARQMVAAFLRTVGGRLCLDIAHRLGRDNLLAVVQGIALDADTTRQTGMHVLELVRERILSGDFFEERKERFASDCLHPLGKGQSRAIMARTFGEFEPRLDVLDGFSAESLAPSVSCEHPQTIALILRQLPPELAAGVLSRLPEPVQGDVAHRMVTSEQVSPDALQRVWGASSPR